MLLYKYILELFSKRLQLSMLSVLRFHFPFHFSWVYFDANRFGYYSVEPIAKKHIKEFITFLLPIYNVVIISTEASFDGDGVIAGDDGGCFNIPGLPTVFFKTISIFTNADET